MPTPRTSTPDASQPQPNKEPHVSVMEWAWAQRDRIGEETALAFARTYGADTGRPSELAQALAAFCERLA